MPLHSDSLALFSCNSVVSVAWRMDVAINYLKDKSVVVLQVLCDLAVLGNSLAILPTFEAKK